MNHRIVALALLLAACGSQPAGNAMTNAAAPDGPMPAGAPPLPTGPIEAVCVMPALDFRAAKLDAKAQAAFTANFKSAVAKACGEKMFTGSNPIVSPKAADPNTLFVMDAPEANVASIYFNADLKPPKSVLEVPFGTPPAVPSAEDLHEAIFCAVKGATEAEQESSGRCLPD